MPPPPEPEPKWASESNSAVSVKRTHCLDMGDLTLGVIALSATTETGDLGDLNEIKQLRQPRPVVGRSSPRGWWTGRRDYKGLWTGPEAQTYVDVVQGRSFAYWKNRARQ